MATPTVTFEKITPALAAKYLEKNADNRPLRQSLVQSIAGAMLRGEFKLTHQGIAFDSSGKLIDGQHRLNALIASQMTLPFMVTRGLPPSTFIALDIGATRSNSDVLGDPRKLVEVGNFASKIVEGRTGRVTPAQCAKYAEIFREPLDALLAETSTSARFFTSTGMRLAACLHLLNGMNRQYVLNTYRQLALYDLESISPIGAALMRQVNGGVAGKTQAGSDIATDALARGMVVFNRANANNKKIHRYQNSVVLDWAREIIEAQLA